MLAVVPLGPVLSLVALVAIAVVPIVVVAIVAVALLAADAPTVGPLVTRASVTPGAPPTWSLVGLGDSVPAGGGCPGCRTFLDLYADAITRDTGHPVDVTNLAVGGATSADVLDALDGRDAADAVAGADLVTVTVGANDVADRLDPDRASDCGGPDDLDCFTPPLSELAATMTRILLRIRALRAGRPTAVRVTGYWNVVLDGAVARRVYPPGFDRVTAALTARTDAVLRATAGAGGAGYVDLRAAFTAASPAGDDTTLLAGDGDHPDQAGHAVIAAALAAAGYAPLAPGR